MSDIAERVEAIPGNAERRLDRALIPLTDHDARTAEPMSRGRRKNWMRNKPCICGSGKKFKVCCWSKYQ